MMITLRRMLFGWLIVIGLCSMILLDATAAELRIYRGELQISFTDPKMRDDLLFRYRSKNRETLRIRLSDLVLMNIQTRERVRLEGRSVKLGNHIDDDGYWYADMVYKGVNASRVVYSVSGRVTQYLAGSVRDRRFHVYLEPQQVRSPLRRPPGSGIDWGLDEERVYK